MKDNTQKNGKLCTNKKPMSMWAVLFIVILAVYLLSFIIPAGQYAREGKFAIPGTYQQIDKIYLNPISVLRDIPSQAYTTFGKLFITILIFGGMMGVVNSTKAMDTALSNLILKALKYILNKSLLILKNS